MSNILVDIRSLLDKPYTGVAQYTLNFLNDLLLRDKKNNYFLFYNSAKYRNLDLSICNNSFFKFARLRRQVTNSHEHIRVLDSHIPNKLFNFCLCFFKWPKIDKLVEKKLGKKIDEVFLPNFNFTAFSKNMPMTLVAHDLSFEIYPQFFTFKQRLWHKLIQPKRLCQQVTKIITHSENTKNDLIRLYKVPADKIEIKTPPISKIFRESTNETELNRVKDKYKLSNNFTPHLSNTVSYVDKENCVRKGAGFVLYLGNLEPRKNLDTLIRAFSQILYSKSYILNPNLIIAGQGREKGKLKKLAKDLGVGDYVKFLGYIPEEDKLALYHLAKVFVYPSFYEGYGYPVAEALACGLPVITSHTSSLTEIESDKITFINPYDINDLSEAIKQFLP